jgi:hypothetical protein
MRRQHSHTFQSQTISRRRHAFLASATIAIGFVIAIAGAEITLRLYHGALFKFEDLRPVPWGFSSKGFAEFDSLLGWVPRPYAQHTWRDGWSARIDGDRLRHNGSIEEGVRLDILPILAVGDSTAFGDEVEDHQSWPAQLERRLGRRVQNAGVGGYGIDQVVLRAKRRLDHQRAAVVVLSFVSPDVTRCAYSFRNRWRPYFRLNGGELTLIPPHAPEVPLPESPLLVALGHTHLGRFVLKRAFPSVWNRRARMFRPHYHLGPEANEWVAERIAERLTELGWLETSE